MHNVYYVPVYSNLEGDVVVPVHLAKGTVAFYAPGFPERDESSYYQTPAYWTSIQAITPVIYKNNYFVVLDWHNIIVETRAVDKLTAVAESSSVSFSVNFSPTYSLLGLGLLLYVMHRVR
jgi:hypothetical protein